jgi:hypothetical protein
VRSQVTGSKGTPEADEDAWPTKGGSELIVQDLPLRSTDIQEIAEGKFVGIVGLCGQDFDISLIVAVCGGEGDSNPR